ETRLVTCLLPNVPAPHGRPATGRPQAGLDFAAWGFLGICGDSWGCGKMECTGVHPCAETLKTPTSQVVRQWGLLRSSPHWRTARLDRLELGGRAVGQRRVQALAVVDLLDESADRRLCRGEVAIGAAVDLLLLQGSHEAL